MTMFDEILEKAAKVADIATQKANEAATISSLKIKRVSLNYDIKDAYQRLGSAIYNMTKNEYEDEEIVKSLVGEIDDLSEKVKELDEKIEKIKGK
jgi:hypothetical protein